MSSSDDEDDFLSADEDGFDDQKAAISTPNKIVAPDLKKNTSSSSSIEEQKLGKGKCKLQIRNEKVIKPTTLETKQENVEKVAIKKADSSKQESDSRPRVVPFESENAARKDGDHDEDDEVALADRIRERNLRIARKFSAEIAKNIKVSVPIPVKGAPIGFKTSDIEYPNIPEFETKSNLPPAPPPTPALSTSFSSELEPTGSPSAGASQYGWRLPNKMQQQSKPRRAEDPDEKGEQARLALDRLSEKLYHSDKNLFEKVAEDIRKVSIKADEPVTSPEGQQSGSSIPLISDLSSTLGGWNWGSATKLLASASQVTSQVGSVFDTVVSVSQQLQQSNQKAQTSVSSSASADSAAQSNDDKNKTDSTETDSSVSSKSGDAKVLSGTSGSISNDPLVGFTLNAMESLGKKAFNVMTERDESGSLQIKGLGRPWERLMNINQPEQQSQPKPQTDNTDNTDSSPISTLDNDAQKKKVESSDGDAKLTSRRRRVNYEDNDKLD